MYVLFIIIFLTMNLVKYTKPKPASLEDPRRDRITYSNNNSMLISDMQVPVVYRSKRPGSIERLSPIENSGVRLS